MRFVITILWVLSWTVSLSQTPGAERKGWSIGLGVGGGALSLHHHDTVDASFSTSLPNLKVGYQLNPRLAAVVIFQGANYQVKGKDRGFEGMTVAAQYWLRDRWWVLGGTGLTFDAPAFYTVKDPAKADFRTGLPALTFAIGYEVYRKGRFVIDLQYRSFYGRVTLKDNSHQYGTANMFIVGFSWY